MKKIVIFLFLIPSISLYCLRDPFCFGTHKKERIKAPIQQNSDDKQLGEWDITHNAGNCLIIKNAEGQTRKIELISFLK